MKRIGTYMKKAWPKKNMWFAYFFAVTIVTTSSLPVFSKTPEFDHLENMAYRIFCEENRRFVIQDQYEAECHHNYHHYNASSARDHYHAFRARHQGDVKIASFNLWHPGTAKSGFQDYGLFAQLMNQWDVVAAQEMVAVVAQNLRNNQEVLNFLETGPELLIELRARLTRNPNDSQLIERIEQLENDLKRAPSLYREPAYLTILHELRKLDSSWALIMAPRGEAAQPQHIQEIAGYFYRGSVVRPKENPHCEEFKERERNGTPYACIPHFYQGFMDRDTAHIFSRRPFMASFRSYQFDFTLLNTHVIFTTSRDEEVVRDVMTTAFGVDSIENMGTGFTIANYARWAEVKLTLEFMERYRQRYNRDDLIFTGDMNLEASNAFWPEALLSYPGAQVYVEDPTTVSQLKYRVNGQATNGFASNYDHFILEPEVFRNCLDESGNLRARVDSFYEGVVGNYIKDTYYIRHRPQVSNDQLIKYDDDYEPVNPSNMGLAPDFPMVDNAEEIMAPFMRRIEELLGSVYTVRNNQIIPDTSRLQQRVDTYRQRIFIDQLYNRTYHRLYQELLSDHHPIVMTCSTTTR